MSAVGSTKYKRRVTMCDINDEECSSVDCNTCPQTLEGRAFIKEELNTKQKEKYTKFEQRIVMYGHTVFANKYRIIATTDAATLALLQDSGGITKHQKPYHPETLFQWAEHYPKLQGYLNLGRPDEIFATKDETAAFRYGNIVFLIAPRVEDVVE